MSCTDDAVAFHRGKGGQPARALTLGAAAGCGPAGAASACSGGALARKEMLQPRPLAGAAGKCTPGVVGRDARRCAQQVQRQGAQQAQRTSIAAVHNHSDLGLWLGLGLVALVAVCGEFTYARWDGNCVAQGLPHRHGCMQAPSFPTRAPTCTQLGALETHPSRHCCC